MKKLKGILIILFATVSFGNLTQAEECVDDTSITFFGPQGTEFDYAASRFTNNLERILKTCEVKAMVESEDRYLTVTSFSQDRSGATIGYIATDWSTGKPMESSCTLKQVITIEDSIVTQPETELITMPDGTVVERVIPQILLPPKPTIEYFNNCTKAVEVK